MKTTPTLEDALQLVESLDVRDDPLGRMLDLLVRLSLEVGIRRCELAEMDLHQINLEQGRILILGRGARPPETGAMTEGTTHAARRWIEVRGDSPGAIFVDGDGNRIKPATITALIRHASLDAGIGPVTPSDLLNCFRALGGRRVADTVRELAERFRLTERSIRRHLRQGRAEKRAHTE